MLEFKRAEIGRLAIHFVGNKSLEQAIIHSESEYKINDDFIRDTLNRYFLNSFKNDIYYQFKSSNEIHMADVHHFAKDFFNKQISLFDLSKKIAEILYEKTVNPKTQGGELYVVEVKDCIVDGEMCDALGIFKSESKETFMKVFPEQGNFKIEAEAGININKVDKGCLIFNSEIHDGLKIVVAETLSRGSDLLYWKEDFLNIAMRKDKFYHTQNLINTTKGFCEEVLTEDNNASKTDQMMVMNRSMNFMKERDKFDIKDFEREVLGDNKEVVAAFNDYRDQYIKDHDISAIDDFEISKSALKKNSKFMKSVLKLDKNFHVYVHGRHDFIEKNYDEDRGMFYYKLFFFKEE
jgi:hypothetical protein